MFSGLLAFFVSFLITYFSIPAIINLSLVKKLYDMPDSRKMHSSRIGALGGVAIFSGFLFSFIFFTHKLYYPELNSLLAAGLILFAIGVKDDLYPLSPLKKAGGQLIAAIIVILQGDIRIQSLYGLFNIHDLEYYTSVTLSILLFLLLINSFNFIDGINGLAASIGVVVISTFGYFFYLMDEELFFILCLAYVGALMAFLRYNFGRARIFMGDSGSLVLGFMITVIALFFVQKSVFYEPNIFFAISSAVFSFAVLIIPVFDTLRVVAIRVFILKKSPFSADRNHIHHALLDIGFTQVQATTTLIFTNAVFIGLAFLLKDEMAPKYQFILYFLLALVLSQVPFLIKKRKKKNRFNA